MDWDEYKVLCERPDYFSRWALDLTASVIDDLPCRQMLADMARREPLEKPDSHRGGAETDYFQVDVALHQAAVIVRQVGAAAAARDGKEQRRLRHLHIVWREYSDFVKGH